VTIQIPRQARLLFTGDSITEAGRDLGSADSLGSGFVRMVSDSISSACPEVGTRMLNTGIGGHRVRDLQSRWTSDVLALHPQLITILIGINDVSRRYDTGDVTTSDEYRDSYTALLRSTSAISAQVVLIEPFLLPVRHEQQRWREDLDPKIAIVRQLAREFDTQLIEADSLMTESAIATGPTPWCPDGVHPSLAGHRLLADAWLGLIQLKPA